MSRSAYPLSRHAQAFEAVSQRFTAIARKGIPTYGGCPREESLCPALAVTHFAYCQNRRKADVMLLALHIDVNDWSRLLGVWVAPAGADGFPEHFYPEPDDGLEIGRSRMEVKGDAVPWHEFFEALPEASPYFSYWAVREVDHEGSLAELFEALAPEVAASARALAEEEAPRGSRCSFLA